MPAVAAALIVLTPGPLPLARKSYSSFPLALGNVRLPHLLTQFCFCNLTVQLARVCPPFLLFSTSPRKPCRFYSCVCGFCFYSELNQHPWSCAVLRKHALLLKVHAWPYGCSGTPDAVALLRLGSRGIGWEASGAPMSEQNMHIIKYILGNEDGSRRLLILLSCRHPGRGSQILDSEVKADKLLGGRG